ncbi:MAG: hypothetical protein Q9170_005646 [Blastenia crenularia]
MTPFIVDICRSKHDYAIKETRLVNNFKTELHLTAVDYNNTAFTQANCQAGFTDAFGLCDNDLDHDVGKKKGGLIQYGAVEFYTYAKKPRGLSGFRCNSKEETLFREGNQAFHRQGMIDFITTQCQTQYGWRFRVRQKFNDGGRDVMYAFFTLQEGDGHSKFSKEDCIAGLTVPVDQCDKGKDDQKMGGLVTINFVQFHVWADDGIDQSWAEYYDGNDPYEDESPE